MSLFVLDTDILTLSERLRAMFRHPAATNKREKCKSLDEGKGE